MARKAGVVIFCVAFCAAVATATVQAIGRTSAEHRARQFIDHWAKRLGDCTPDTVHRLPPSERPDLIYVRQFENGEWLLARGAHACAGGDFDATVFRDSAGTIHHQRTHHFCGYEGLSGELDAIAAKSLSQFYRQLAEVVDLSEWTP